jgi:branched-chain amino acid transport system permease protein
MQATTTTTTLKQTAKSASRSFLIPLIAFVTLGLINLVFQDLFNPYIQQIIIYACINSILAVSLNLVNGFTGQFSIGHAGFMAAGAYTAAFLTTHVSGYLGGAFDAEGVSGLLFNLEFLLNTLAGGLVAALVGFLVGLPSLKLKGDYLAIVTLGFGEIIRVVLLNLDVVGGARGMYGIPKSAGFYWASAWAAFTIFVVWRLIRSSHGRTFLAVREDEIAAESVGVNTTTAKTKAFVISSFFAGVAGSIFAHYLAYLNPSSFTFMKSIDVVVMVVLGGMGSISGSVLAACIITILPEALRPLQEITRVDFRMVIYSLMLVFLMLTRPQGLFGHKEITDFFRKKKA